MKGVAPRNLLHKLAQPRTLVTLQCWRSGKRAHLGTSRTQGPSHTLSPSFRGKGRRAFFSCQLKSPRHRSRGPSSGTHCLAPTVHQGPGWMGVPARRACRSPGWGNPATRRPGLGSLSPPRTFVSLTAVRCARWGPLSPAVLETPKQKTKFCSREDLGVDSVFLFSQCPCCPLPPAPPQSRRKFARPAQEAAEEGQS